MSVADQSGPASRCPLLAQSRHRLVHRTCPLSGIKRTSGAARRNELQKSLNLALGSSLATIGLTIPAVAITNIFLGNQIELGLSARDTLLLALTLFLSLLTFGSGWTNILAGLVHLVVFATFLFLVFIP